jgi:hypothetical protein
MSIATEQEEPFYHLYAPALTAKEPYSTISAILKELASQGYDQQTLNLILQQFQEKYNLITASHYQKDSLFPLYALAFETENPDSALTETIKGLLEQRYDRKILVHSLTHFGLMLRSEGKDEDEDIVLDLLDALTGWCHPSARL